LNVRNNGDNTTCNMQRRSVISPAVETDNRWRLAQSHRGLCASRFSKTALYRRYQASEQKSGLLRWM